MVGDGEGDREVRRGKEKKKEAEDAEEWFKKEAVKEGREAVRRANKKKKERRLRTYATVKTERKRRRAIVYHSDSIKRLL